MDIQFCCKECAREVEDPSARDMQRAKRPRAVLVKWDVETGTLEGMYTANVGRQRLGD